jgi:hypothetical protein
LFASCSDCTPEQRIENGCEGGESVIWFDPITEDEYYVCPIRFVTNNIIEWYNEYSYNMDFPGTARKYGEQSNKFIDAAHIYKRNLHELGIIANGGSVPDKEVKNG